MTEGFDLTRPIPVLILGDGPDQPTGLGRIGHDLAHLLCSMPEFQVGYLGRAAFGSTRFPWVQYSFPETAQWGEGYLQQAWENLSRGRRGIIFTIWDATRLLWFANPVGLPNELRGFLESCGFERWGYFMQDCEGVQLGRLPLTAAEVMSRYDRVLLASKWAHEITRNSIKFANSEHLDWMPHPIERSVFRPSAEARASMRSAWGVGNTPLVGCVMSNQARKHWPTVIEAVANCETKPKLWIHTDRLMHYWNIDALCHEYGLHGRIIYEGRQLSDKELAMRYNACDATVVISGGEGFCYPVAESLSCGVPCVTGDYGAQAELAHATVPVRFSTIETQHNVRRAYYSPSLVAQLIDEAITHWSKTPETEIAKVEHLDMPKLGIQWKKWFKKGIAQ